MTAPVSIVIPACRGTEPLREHLPMVMAEVEQRGVGDEVIVVDDTGSTEVREWISQNCATVRGVGHSRARGYGRSLLSGAWKARHDLVLFLAEDVRVHSGFLSPLVESLGHDVLAACPVFVSDTRRTQETGDGPVGSTTSFFEIPGTEPAPESIDARALLIRKVDLPGKRAAELLFPNCIDPSEIRLRPSERGNRVVRAVDSEVDDCSLVSETDQRRKLRKLMLGRNALLAHWLYLEDESARSVHTAHLRTRVAELSGDGDREQLTMLAMALGRLRELNAARVESREPEHLTHTRTDQRKAS